MGSGRRFVGGSRQSGRAIYRIRSRLFARYSWFHAPDDRAPPSSTCLLRVPAISLFWILLRGFSAMATARHAAARPLLPAWATAFVRRRFAESVGLALVMVAIFLALALVSYQRS